MARYRNAQQYRVFYHHTGVQAGLTDVIVGVEGGDFYRYERLKPEAARLILDLLRNEDPIVIELDSGLLQVPSEPIGDGE